MSAKSQRRWTAEEKLKLLDEARQGALTALRQSRRGRKRPNPTTQLQTEIDRLRTVVTELSAENLQLKKGLWP